MKKRNSDIKIRNVSGNVIISQGQKGGVTAHDNINKINKPNDKSFFTNKYVLLIGFVASVLGILTYFGLQPVLKNNMDISKPINAMYKDDTTKILKNNPKQKLISQLVMRKSEDDSKKKEKPISVRNVTGDVVISQNQTGGITAHTVNVNTDRNINQSVSDKISSILKASNCQITIGALGMGGENDKLANQLLIAAQNSGCATNGVNHGIGFQAFNGLQIQVSQINPLLVVARSLESILLDASIECSVVYGPNLTEGNIYLYVGYKP